ncbi:MAG: M23 family metallopeptidase [Chloroflexota bacterium]
MRTALVLIVALLVPLLPAAAATPPDDPEPMPSMHCLERMNIPAIPNIMEARWSPDSHTLAIVWFAQLPSARSPKGYVEQEVTDTLDLRTGRLWPVGVGDQPEWSTTGELLSYWGPRADELRITRDARVIARLTPTIPRVRWVRDRLLFIEKDEIREWRDGTVRGVAKLEDRFVPKYPRDDVYFSADGTRFTLTRYSLDGTLERYLGTTSTGVITPLEADGAGYIEWAPAGGTLLVRYPDRIELRDMGTGTRSIAPTTAAGRVHHWAPDGRTLLVGNVSPTVPAGDAYDPFRIWNAGGAAAATLPNLIGARAFSPDGKYFVGASRTGTHTTRLEIYRCRGTADAARAETDAPARRGAIEAASGRTVRPVSGVITQFLQGRHTGVDLAVPFGTLITASDDGVVDAIGWVAVGGNRVCVQHQGGLQSCYYHTSLPLVTMGERVARGQPVALIGMTGVTTGPHTHWEQKLFGRIVDPLDR